tara:strand:- start:259 stop:522 length:264 start_codon:yes stop_codon:yes gene_type:complete
MTAKLANELESQYPNLNFRNHCYLRIAYDNVLHAKWDTVVSRPFVAKASPDQIDQANKLLTLYKTDKDLLMQHNKRSLTFRIKNYDK